MDIQEKEKKEYELALLVKNEGDLAGVMTLLGQHSAEMIGEPRAKNLAFAYEVEGTTDGVFAYCRFHAMPDAVKELEKDLGNNKEVLRSLIIASPAPAERSSPGIAPMPHRGGRPSSARSTPSMDARPAPSGPISNEALEKKIEEILK